MPINTKTESDYFAWQELANLEAAEEGELEDIKCHLDLVFLALEAIANITSEAMIQAAQDLDLASMISDRSVLWKLGLSNSKPKTNKNTEEAKKTDIELDVEEVRSLVLIICYLANQHQELLRRGVSLLEQVTEQNELPQQTALLGNYLDRFINSYQAKIANPQPISSVELADIAWKLLSSLLFYSGHNGHRLLWSAIFDAAQTNAD